MGFWRKFRVLRCRLYGKRGFWLRILGYVSLFSFISISIQVIWSREYAFYNPAPPHFNYFLEASEHAKMGYMVDTKHCRILNISAWHKSILPFTTPLAPAPNCKKTQRQWTFVKNQNVIVNRTALKESGYTWSSISCCYKVILRVNQSLDNYNSDADRLVQYPEECKPMGIVTPLEHEFIRVFCKSKYWPLSMDIIYRYYHAVPIPQNKKAKEKIECWRRQQKNKKLIKDNSSTHPGKDEEENSSTHRSVPPNVVILGIDSMSRLSFQRNMPNTRDFLKEIGAIEMLGYTKLGENTFPNAVAFTMGYQSEELPLVCNYSMSHPLDPCPFIWKEFSEANYLTAFIEDVPLLATFNHYKTGFVESPTDFYFRPFMLGVHYRAPRRHYYTLDCIGGKTVDETIHKYMEDILRISYLQETPSFIYTWLTNLAHQDLNAAQFADDAYKTFLKRLDLSNTILFFMSDHGYRYGEIRQTFAGWYEDKLPNFWVYIPNKIREEFPHWYTNLLLNSRRLSSPLDLYHTLSHIVKKFKTNPEISPEKIKNSSKISRKFGQSLFSEIPSSRRCKDAGIAEHLCACVAPKRLETNDTNLIKSAQTAIKSINKILPKQCHQLTLTNLIAGGVIDKVIDDNLTEAFTYVAAFETNPGDFLFEASVDYFPKNGSYQLIGDLLRMNKINSDVSCVKNDFLEKVCYCSFTNENDNDLND